MTLIAIEEHWTSPELATALAEAPPERRDPSLVLNEHGAAADRLTELDARRIADMNEQGVDIQVISLAPPGTGPLDAADAVPLSRELNDLAAAAVARHPTRLRAMATLPLADPAACAGELERAASNGLVGAMVYGQVQGRQLDDPAYTELFAAAAALGMPMFLHPQIPPAGIRAASYSGFDDMTELALATFGWGWHLEAAISALRLIARGTFDRHPELQVILGHWGELLPFWSDRTDSIARVAGLQRTVAETLRTNFHLTCSGMLSPTLLRHAREVTTPDRLLFSTDYPFQRPTASDITAFLGEFEDEGERDAFTAGNARRLLRLGEGTGR